MRTLLALGLFIFSINGFAEYRAYELLLVDTATGQESVIISTFDHIQYPGYHPIGPTQTLSYLDSWMCYENTSGFKPICPKPEEREPAASP